VLTKLAGALDQPTDSQSLLTVSTDFNRNLVGSTANAARPDFNGRTNVVQSTVENGDRILLELGFDDVESTIDDGFGSSLLAVLHQGVHELGEHQIAILGIWNNVTLLCAVATGHDSGSPYFGRFAPYLDRRCLRSFTLWVSRTPRRM